jgi:hypothetical protein
VLICSLINVLLLRFMVHVATVCGG